MRFISVSFIKNTKLTRKLTWKNNWKLLKEVSSNFQKSDDDEIAHFADIIEIPYARQTGFMSHHPIPIEHVGPQQPPCSKSTIKLANI